MGGGFDSVSGRVPYTGDDGAGRGSKPMFTGVKVFSATKAKEREELGEAITRWLKSNADLEIVDRVVCQSSDNEFHCYTVVLFYRPANAASARP
jgi:hypothetical protein